MWGRFIGRWEIMDEKKVSNVQSLVAAIAPKMKEQDKAKGQKANFNIFFSTGIWHKEVYICRLLCDLLSPKGGSKTER